MKDIEKARKDVENLQTALDVMESKVHDIGMCIAVLILAVTVLFWWSCG